MHMRAAALVIACCAALPALFGMPSAAIAQSADLVLCDRIAADPSDPDKPADVAGVPRIAAADIPTALKFCKAASKSRRALYQLGRAYAAASQPAEAARAYREAAEKGSSAAMVELGVAYGTGTGVAKSLDEARKLFDRAAKAGNPRGLTNMAALSGGTPANTEQNRAALAKAAEANSAEAQFQLGLMYAQGEGAAKDDVAARGLFEKAAAQGHVLAALWAGMMAQRGRGGPEDEKVAKSYYEKAAAGGNEEAKAALKRIECPYVLKNKRGEVWSNLCM